MPSLDIRHGACAHSSAASGDALMPFDDPLAVVRAWARLGFQRVHVVDLDAAAGEGSNASLLRAVLDERAIDMQVGGGIRSADQVERLLDDGAQWVVIGSRAIEEPEWLADTAAAFAGSIIVAIDVSERHILPRGWARRFPRLALDVVEELTDHPIAGFLVTAVPRVGQLNGTDLSLMEDVASAATVPVYAAGGISTLAELRDLADRGVAGAVVGMALQTGALDASYVAAEFRD